MHAVQAPAPNAVLARRVEELAPGHTLNDGVDFSLSRRGRVVRIPVVVPEDVHDMRSWHDTASELDLASYRWADTGHHRYQPEEGLRNQAFPTRAVVIEEVRKCPRPSLTGHSRYANEKQSERGEGLAFRIHRTHGPTRENGFHDVSQPLACVGRPKIDRGTG
jgi:hypothetical protein